MQLADKAGIRPRHVGLFGHVVMEAWYDGEWHMYDPDFEVIALDDSGSVLRRTTVLSPTLPVASSYGKLKFFSISSKPANI